MKNKTQFKPGKIIYLGDDYNLDEQIVGGRAIIESVDLEKKYVKLKGFLAYRYNLDYLAKNQEAWKKKYRWKFWKWAHLIF